VCEQATNTCVQAPPECVPELLFLRGNPAFGLVNGQLFHISPKDLVEKSVFTELNQSDGGYSPDGSKLAWVQSNQILWVSDADGQNPVKIDDVSAISSFTAISNPRWSPDGTRLAYQVFPVGQPDVHIWTSSLTGSPTNITSNAEADAPEWSPDGAKILFESTRTGNLDIFTMNADGSSQTNLTHTTGDQQAPHWSPDGNAIVFSSAFEIWQMNSDGSARQAITSVASGVSDTDARWVSNQLIVYTHSVSAEPSQLYVTSPQGTNQHIFAEATNTVGGQSTPMPSPDGKYIAWSENDSGQTPQMWLSTVDMVMATRITNSSGLNNIALGWKPCP
jgi:Tol biopolymer transport system component